MIVVEFIVKLYGDENTDDINGTPSATRLLINDFKFHGRSFELDPFTRDIEDKMNSESDMMSSPLVCVLK